MQCRNFNQAGAGAPGLPMWPTGGQARALSMGKLTSAEAGRSTGIGILQKVLGVLKPGGERNIDQIGYLRRCSGWSQLLKTEQLRGHPLVLHQSAAQA